MGISVHGIDTDPMACGMASKYLHAHLLPSTNNSEENRLQFLVDLGKKLGQKTVLFPVSDDDVVLCSKERTELEKYYLYVMPDHSTVMNMLSKDGLSRAAKSCGIPSPQMFVPTDIRELEAIAGQLPYPVIIKPVISPSWLRPEIIKLLRDNPLSGPPKVVFCPGPETLLQNYRKVTSYDSRVIIQEVIPGEDDCLVYFCFYLDRQNKPLATFAGRKLRLLPVGFGSASYVRSFYDQELEEISLQLLHGVAYKGLGGIEFKKDPRDGKYKLIEFNARFGMWDALSVHCGVDIPYISYSDAIGQRVEAQRQYQENIAWFDLQRDIRAFVIYRSQRKLTFVQWLRTFRGEKDWSVYAADDWKPALYSLYTLLERPKAKIKKHFFAIR
jgi:predicted ATP-grasp superfamily ATP-dependent carboligase